MPSHYLIYLGLLSVACIPLKLAAAYALLFPYLLLWYKERRLKINQGEGERFSATLLPCHHPFLILVSAFAICSLFGINFVRSLSHLPSLLLLPVVALAYADLTSRVGVHRLLVWLLGGQAVAAIFTIICASFPETFPRFLLPRVTESGQIAITLVPAIALCLHPTTPKRMVQSVAFFVLPLITLSLLINLKRGPWVGASIALIIFLAMYRRKLLAYFLGAVTLIILCFSPIRTRLGQVEDHFFVAGGRSTIWEIGLELASKYPLGIGYENAPFLRKFSADIPSDLRHFHNNILNVLVEGGWIALFIYLWWITYVIRLGFKRSGPEAMYRAAIACGLIGWQIAGLVEYNFGDSEVALIAFVALGILSSLSFSALPAERSPNLSQPQPQPQQFSALA